MKGESRPNAPHCILTVTQARIALSELRRVGMSPIAEELLERALLNHRKRNNLNSRFKPRKDGLTTVSIVEINK